MKDSILEVVWSKEDIANALIEHGHAPSDSNIERVINTPKLLEYIEEESVARGWDIIHTAIDSTFATTV